MRFVPCFLPYQSKILTKLRAQVPEPQSSDEEAGSSQEHPSQSNSHADRHVRTKPTSPDDSEYDSGDGPGFRETSSTDVMVKKLVRLALSSEYSRQPIRRVDISNKVLGEQGSRQFKVVFAEAQRVLADTFGMQLAELPGKEKVTIQQRRGEYFSFPLRVCKIYDMRLTQLEQLRRKSKGRHQRINRGFLRVRCRPNTGSRTFYNRHGDRWRVLTRGCIRLSSV